MMLTRLAPSPTGALHLGNARTFLINWILAKQNGWRILLRIEDLDGPRVKPWAQQQLIDDLRWIGLTWDDGPIIQSQRAEIYSRAVHRLIESGDAYPCICTRKEVELAASAPHAEDGAAVYPGTCRGRFKSIEEARLASERSPAIRFRTDTHREVQWHDEFLGLQSINVAQRLGDFVIAKSDGTAAYQLAVVVDDAAAGVTHVVRGDDLIDSTPRQILLYRAIELGDHIPKYFHLPLIIGPDGKRLAKRHGDTRVSYYREKGVSPSRLLALLARWSGITDVENEISLDEFASRFDLTRLPKNPVTMRPEDDRWLLGKE